MLSFLQAGKVLSPRVQDRSKELLSSDDLCGRSLAMMFCIAHESVSDHTVNIPDASVEVLTHCLQYLVAGGMAESVVDDLEIV